MLSGKNVGRRHQGALFATFGYGKHGKHRDDRFSAADVTLEQGVKLLFSAETVADFVNGFGLPGGEGER